MAECTHNCSTCKSKCSEIKFFDLLEGTKIKHIIGVVSGKGGVGKSLVTSLIASKMAKLGYKVGILDSDITGPSIPKSFGVHGMARGNNQGIDPMMTKEGIELMSVNCLVRNESDPIIYRGPALVNLVKQFYSNVIWGELDYLFIDMPPGTADITLTVFQQIPVDGLIVVTTPQDLVKLIVEKSINMANILHKRIIGLVENMSYVKCPHCGKKIELFGKSHIKEIAESFHLPVLASLPIDPEIQTKVDEGEIYSYDCEGLDALVGAIK